MTLKPNATQLIMVRSLSYLFSRGGAQDATDSVMFKTVVDKQSFGDPAAYSE
jgi:hypothetical protein